MYNEKLMPSLVEMFLRISERYSRFFPKILHSLKIASIFAENDRIRNWIFGANWSHVQKFLLIFVFEKFLETSDLENSMKNHIFFPNDFNFLRTEQDWDLDNLEKTEKTPKLKNYEKSLIFSAVKSYCLRSRWSL